MQHYYKKVLNNQKRIILREQALQECLKNEQLKPEEIESLKESYQNYSYAWYGIRAVPVFAIGFLTKFGILSRPSRFFLKEIVLIGGFTGFIIGLDFQNSEYLWAQSGQLVKQYVNYSDNLIIDDKRLNQMRQMYERKNSRKNNTQAEEVDSKMYQDEDDK